jgi:hypothetical protein
MTGRPPRSYLTTEIRNQLVVSTRPISHVSQACNCGSVAVNAAIALALS